ncbi:hypothetical protein Tco_0540162 [Tanacetum coccineum]
MDDPNMTMEEYIKLEEEKARRHGRVFNWMHFCAYLNYVDDLDFFKDFENEFPAIVYTDAQMSKSDYLTKQTLSPQHNNESDLKDETSLSEYDEVGQNVLYFNDLFPFNVIHPDDLKSNEDNDNNKIDVIQSSEGSEITHGSNVLSKTSHDKMNKTSRTRSFVINLNVNIVIWNYYANRMLFYLIMNFNVSFGVPFDPKRYYKDGNCAIMLRRPRSIQHIHSHGYGVLTNFYPILKPQYDVFVIEYDVLMRNGSLVLKPIRRIDETPIRHIDHIDHYTAYLFMNTSYPPSEQKVKKFYNLCAFVVGFADMAPLPLREQRYPFLRYQGLEYTDADIAEFEERLERFYSREIHRVQVVYFLGMPKLMRDGLFARMVMEHRDDAGGARRRLSWRQFILALGLHTREEMVSPGFVRYWSESERMIPGKGDLHDYWRSISTDGDFLGPSPSYTLIRDPVLRLCHRMMAHSIAGRSQAPEKVTVTDLFYLRGLDVGSVNIPYLLARYLRRFAAGRKSGAHISGGQSVARFAEHFELLTAKILGGLMVIAPELPIIDMGELDAPIVDEGGQADPSPVQALPPPPAAAKTMPQRMARLEEDVHEIHGALTEQREVIDAMARDFSRFSTWAVTGLARMMDRAGVTYVPYSETHVPYQRRRVRQWTCEASTSAAQQDPQQPDP